LSASHIILREVNPKEILRWIIKLWERKLELYGEATAVGSVIALNIKFLFHVKDAKRVFYDSKIREVGAVPTNIQTDPNEYFKVEHDKTKSHLFFLYSTEFENPIEQFIMAAEMVVFSFETQTFAEIRERGEKILQEGFGIHGGFTIVRAAPNDPTKKGKHTKGAYTRFLQFYAAKKKYMYNVSNGQIFVFHGKDNKELTSYTLWNGDLKEAEILKPNIPKQMRIGEFIFDHINEAWYNFKESRWIKPFMFKHIPKQSKFVKRPPPPEG
jgi:hypothetical protein